MFNPKIFKSYDIRGIFNEDFDLNFVNKFAIAFSNWCRRDQKLNNNEELKIVVARDMRLSSPEISKELISGLIKAGVHVLDIGLNSSPSFYYNSSYHEANAGIMVSASHNPKEWNGFKLVRSKSRPISENSGIMFIRDNFQELSQLNPDCQPGRLEEISGASEKQLLHDFNFIKQDRIKPFLLAIDPANSMGAQYLEPMIERLGLNVKKINFELDGSFPAHEADPLKMENLKDLQKLIIESKADLGIATDGDGDRVFFLDNNGDLIEPAIIRGLLAKIFLEDKPGSKIAYDVRPGKITQDLIIESGGVPIQTKVGHSLIKEAMLEQDIYFAGESSGHFFLNLDIGCFEMPIIMIGKLLELFSSTDKTVAEYINPLRHYSHSGEINLDVEDKGRVFEFFKDKFKDAELSFLDGISVNYPDYWFNLRASNTENKIRLNLEAKDSETMIKKRDEVLNLFTNL